ncbi:DUF924 domain-containing protein [Rhodobacteraceae bacterium N5(2021)]|uniref:DUF924 domain-containing protein n=1 Tax=Gymnodinialimonas phycosphaerae TaxID=2841589 RepID=A0A975YH45_9RHOB|nr:DUF924 family protein [Gymnodinialimonas phycosphaerae]MBY4892388.1 DUF924 domain-containing protein [Gymnodinialimonas phycosphaerae]
MTRASDVVTFWLNAGPEKWYAKDDAFDAAIRDQFGQDWHAAHAGSLPDWATNSPGALALVILLDQFPRNMLRDDPRAFATDAKALEISSQCVAKGWDHEIAEPERQFIYMPYMHSEDMDHQNTCVDLFETRMAGGNNALHARVHREIIARFGRFPYRNAALGRDMTPEEQAFIDGGGYGAILREMEGN